MARGRARFSRRWWSPAIVGRKRVERNIARWKVDPDIMAAAKGEGTEGRCLPRRASDWCPFSWGQIRSLTCQVLELKDRVDILERQLREIQG